jgi:S-adenosylmethionine/arginine decarboxylase-like enzyme
MNKSEIEKDKDAVRIYRTKKPWGMNVSIDLHDCDPKMIRDEKVIIKFIESLVKHIKMKAYGEPMIENFGANPKVTGISAMQLIETSGITMHFVNAINAAYIDIFSCKPFKPHETAHFCKKYLKASDVVVSPTLFRF